METKPVAAADSNTTETIRNNDDSTGAFKGQTAALYYDPRASYGNSSQDQRQVFSSSILYLLPFGRGQRCHQSPGAIRTSTDA